MKTNMSPVFLWNNNNNIITDSKVHIIFDWRLEFSFQKPEMIHSKLDGLRLKGNGAIDPMGTKCILWIVRLNQIVRKYNYILIEFLKEKENRHNYHINKYLPLTKCTWKVDRKNKI